jgi:hypothetical protein
LSLDTKDSPIETIKTVEVVDVNTPDKTFVEVIDRDLDRALINFSKSRHSRSPSPIPSPIAISKVRERKRKHRNWMKSSASSKNSANKPLYNKLALDQESGSNQKR